jgi:YVTN family beta-propeller protein
MRGPAGAKTSLHPRKHGTKQKVARSCLPALIYPARLAEVHSTETVKGSNGIFAANRHAFLRRGLAPAVVCGLVLAAGCRRNRFPDVPAGYREFAYVTNGTSNTVSVLDLVYVRQDRTLQVGANPSGATANPKRNEVYVVNTGSGSVSVIETETNRVAATIPVHKQPYAIDVDEEGRRGYVANSGSNTVSVIDLVQRREIGVVGVGEQPALARISPDGRSLVVTNRLSGSVSVFAVSQQPTTADATGLGLPGLRHTDPEQPEPMPKLRAAYPGCPGATDAVILPDSSKAFVACSGGGQVMVISLAAAPDTWAAKQDQTLLTDHLITFLDVGKTPVHLALKPDGGEIFCSNFGSDSISEIETQTNEVGGTYTIASRPVFSVVSADDSMLWVSNFGGDSINLWSIDDGKMGGSVRTGQAPAALAFSTDEHLLLAADSRSGDVSVIRTQSRNGPALFTILPSGGSPNAIAVKSWTSKP